MIYECICSKVKFPQIVAMVWDNRQRLVARLGRLGERTVAVAVAAARVHPCRPEAAALSLLPVPPLLLKVQVRS